MSQQLLIIVGISSTRTGYVRYPFCCGFPPGAKFSFSEKCQFASQTAQPFLCQCHCCDHYIFGNISQVSHVYLGWVCTFLGLESPAFIGDLSWRRTAATPGTFTGIE